MKKRNESRRRACKPYHSIWEVADEVWHRVRHRLPLAKLPGTVGRPAIPNRKVFLGSLHVVRTGCQWKSLRREWFGAASSIHRRFQEWEQAGIWQLIFRLMLTLYEKLRKIQWRWLSIDSKSVPAPLGGKQTGKCPTDRGKLGAKWHMLVDQRGAPLGIVISAANTHDKRCAIEVLRSCPLPRPRRRYRVHHLCADKGYDYKDIRCEVHRRRFHVHIARRGDRSKPIKCHPARRWVVERTNSWQNQYRGLRVRWAKKSENWLAFNHLASAITLCRMAIYG